MSKYNEFTAEYPIFRYKSYTITENEKSVDVAYVFTIDGLIEFHPGWSFPKPEGLSVKDDLRFERLAFCLGLAEAISYWKASCSPEVIIECGSLDEWEIAWWKKLWYLGLGEFFYTNGISTDRDSFVNMRCTGGFDNTKSADMPEPTGCLVPIGGGKDSALTLETLTRAGMKCRCYSINKRCSITATVEAAGLPDDTLIRSQRRFDRTLVDLNNRGFLNGHTPFSSIVAFSAEITAYLHGLKYIVLSNEDSANESTVAGQDVNHQYSKSFEFECDFHEYEHRLGTGAYYFSFLRPLAEFQIAKMFVTYRKYIPVFRSCNLGNKVSPDIWCSECPKCLFVSLILSPFLTRAELAEIFGKDLLDDPTMQEYFIELIGRSEHKPFECVGSINEVNLSVSLAIEKMLKNGEELPLLFRNYIEIGAYEPESIAARNEKICSGFSEQNLLPEEFKEILVKEMERLL